MALDPCLVKLMAQTIYVARQSATVSLHGDRTWGTPETAKARVEPNRKVFDDANGQQSISDYAIYTTTRVGLKDRVWLPGADQTSAAAARQPKRVFAGIDVDGSTSHYEVYV